MLTDLPLVSIVTPSLNQGQFIAEAIDSVLNQDYPRLEYLVVDGGSTDNTLDILRTYGGRLRWVSEPDEGQSAAINKGWRMARGEIIAWLNSDDRLLPGAVSRAVAFLQQHPEVAAVYGDCDYVDSLGRVIHPYPARRFDYLELVRSTLNFIPQPAVFICRRALESVGYLDEALHFVMDLDYWLRLGAKHAMAYLPQRLATLRLHSRAKSIESLAHFGPELIRVYQRLFAMPDLPAAVYAVRAEAMSVVYYRAANCYFLSGDFAEARRHAIMGWRYSPFNLHWVLFKVIGLGSLGKAGRWIAKHLRRDPLMNI